MKPHRHHEHEHDREPVPGLPARLPEGERLLWQGAPDWRGVARQVGHVRKVAAWFALLAGWRVAAGLHDGDAAADIAAGLAWTLAPAAAAIGLVLLLSWLVARTTLYTITDRRVVMRVGVVLSISFNLPYRAVVSAGLRRGSDGRGDIALALDADSKIAWLHLWPHARPWRFSHPEPTLRALPRAESVARLLADALAAAHAADASATAPQTRDAREPREAAAPSPTAPQAAPSGAVPGLPALAA